MAKSRVEKNKNLYEELELDSFELEDIVESKNKEVKIEKQEDIANKQEVVPLKKSKKNEVVVVEKKEKIKVDDVAFDEANLNQPISYTDKLSIEEILRAKLEKQQKLKEDKKVYKKSPITKTYTPEMMQKNINQKEGIDIRKEANIRVRKNNNSTIAILFLLLLAVIIAGVVLIYVIL